MKYITRTTMVTVLPDTPPLFSEMVTHISITEASVGEFVEVKQERGTIAITPEEWPAIRAAVDKMIAECRKGEV